MRIVIDPGHGGEDPGAVGNLSKEKDNVLELSLMLRDELLKYGIDVYLTRENDKYVSLPNRYKFINNLKPDLSISIHNNSYRDKTAHGFEVWYHRDDSINIASKLVNNICKYTMWKPRGIKQTNELALCVGVKYPAVLMECGFISNVLEEKEIITKDFKSRIIKGVLESLDIKEHDEFNDAEYFVKSENISDGARGDENVTRSEVWTMIYRLCKNYLQK